jgi:hypothetical protein
MKANEVRPSRFQACYEGKAKCVLHGFKIILIFIFIFNFIALPSSMNS